MGIFGTRVSRVRRLVGSMLGVSVTCGACAHELDAEGADASAGGRVTNGEDVDASPAYSSDQAPSTREEEGVWKSVAEVPADAEGYLGTFDVASTPNVGLVVYRECETQQSEIVASRVALRQFDREGTPIGEPQVLDETTEALPEHAVTVATSGEHSVACWQGASKISCVPIEGDAVVSRCTQHFDGVSPKILPLDGGWVLAYLTADDGSMVLELLDLDLARTRDAVTFPPSGSSTPPTLSVTGNHVALLAGSPEPNDREAHLYRLDANLEAEHPPVSLGLMLWSGASVASLGDRALASIATPYTGHLVWVDESNQTSSLEIPGGGKNGNFQQIAPVPDGFFVAWYDTETHIASETFASPLYGSRSEVALVSMSLRLMNMGSMVLMVSHRAADPRDVARNLGSRRSIAVNFIQ